MRLGFAIDNRACIGCHACTVACKAEHSVPIGVNRTWVKYIEKGSFPETSRAFNVQRCNHCEAAPCVTICPVTSLYRRPDGIVDFDRERCIGCKACMQACPYDALYLDPETSTAAKCNYCTHRVDRGLEPACVVVCPVEAIVSGDLDDPTSRISQLDRRLPVQYPKVDKGTRPKLFYVGGETAALTPLEAPPATSYLWSAIPTASLERAQSEAEDEARARRVYDASPKGSPWGKLVSAYVTTKAAAAGVPIVAFLAFLFGGATRVLPTTAAAVALFFLAVTGVLLVADLKRPERFLSVLLRPQWRSWLVRGAYVILGFSLALPLAWWTGWAGLGRPLQLAAGALLVAIACGTAAYTAFLLAQGKGRDWWQDPLLPIELLADALLAGFAIAPLLAAAGRPLALSPLTLRIGLGATIVFVAVCQKMTLLTPHATAAAARVAKSIVRGEFAPLFWGVVVAIGAVLPLALLAAGAPTALAAASALVGLAAKNHVLVAAPQRVPLS